MVYPEDGRYQSAQQLAYQFIRDQIIEGAIEGGAKLNPTAIAETLGISRMPVREAIVQLGTEGLVINRPNRGAIVTPLMPDDVEELFEMRASLEGLAARHAARLCTEANLGDLEALANRMERTVKDAEQWMRLHDEFHDLVCQISGRKRLTEELRRVRAAAYPYVLLYNRVFERVEMEGAEHLALVVALRSRDSLLAERLFTHHVASASVGVTNFLRDRQKQKLAMAKSSA